MTQAGRTRRWTVAAPRRRREPTAEAAAAAEWAAACETLRPHAICHSLPFFSNETGGRSLVMLFFHKAGPTVNIGPVRLSPHAHDRGHKTMRLVAPAPAAAAPAAAAAAAATAAAAAATAAAATAAAVLLLPPVLLQLLPLLLLVLLRCAAALLEPLQPAMHRLCIEPSRCGGLLRVAFVLQHLKSKAMQL
eukprot:44349-Chlamydomonas_euryale.AAC.4